MVRLAGNDFMLYFKAPSRHLLKKSDQTVAVLGLAHAHLLCEPGTCTPEEAWSSSYSSTSSSPSPPILFSSYSSKLNVLILF